MGDTYRPSRSERPPSLMDRMTFTSGGGDNYRPGDARSHAQGGGQNRNHADFTFSSGRPGPQFPPAGPGQSRRRRNRGGGPNPNDQRDTNRSANSRPVQSRDRRNHNNYRRGRGGRGNFRKAAPHERPLLQARGGTSPEHVLGVTDGSNKFLDLDDLSEEDTDMESDSDNSPGGGDGEQGGHKVARVQASNRADGNSVPKWSNPDPYTVLPPDEPTSKKKDVVKLIRKAKNQSAEKAVAGNAVAANDDFISFGDDDDDELVDDAQIPPPPPPPPMWARSPSPPPPPPPPPRRGSMNQAIPQKGLGIDIARAAASSTKPQHLSQKALKRKRGEFEGGVVREWLPSAYGNLTPWCKDYGHLRSEMTKWLHNEIMDFYDFVRPSEEEGLVRQNLIQRVESVLAVQSFPQWAPGRVLCFGSFPADLYLPTADMDLVFATDHFRERGEPWINLSSQKQINNVLFKVARRLESRGIAVDVQVIAKAKVPIIKFVDNRTGIKVDLSFENMSGVDAQKTYFKWKADFPDMVYMVALVKQFLAMRGLNEVHTGGVGGFSIICLVVSFIQLQPKPADLGEMFLHFLDYYGNKFDLARKRIVMEPPALVNKTAFGIDGRKEKADGLSIQDPHRGDNNISGGTMKSREIFQAFASAHRILQERITAFGSGTTTGSILEPILGGNYETYDLHRARITSVK